MLLLLPQGATMLLDSAFGDLWMPLSVFIMLGVTLGIGLSRLLRCARSHHRQCGYSMARVGWFLLCSFLPDSLLGSLTFVLACDALPNAPLPLLPHLAHMLSPAT